MNHRSQSATEVVIAGAGPNGLMWPAKLALAGIRPVVLDPMPGPNPQARVLTGTEGPPKPAPRSMFAGFALDLGSVPGSQLFVVPVQQRGLLQVLAERAGEYDADIRWGHTLTGFEAPTTRRPCHRHDG